MLQAIHLLFSPICVLDHFCWSMAEGKWRNEAKKIFKWKGDICVISLSSRFIVVLLLRLPFEKEKNLEKKKRCTFLHRWCSYSSIVLGGEREMCYLTGGLTSCYCRLKCSIKTLTSRVRIPTSPVLMKSWNILFSAIKHTHKETRKRKKGEKKHLVTYLLNKCNIGVYLWQDWRAGVMNGFSEVI